MTLTSHKGQVVTSGLITPAAYSVRA